MRSPGFSAFAVFILAVGIGANSAIFSVVNSTLLRPLHYQNPEQLVWIWATRKDVSRAFYSIPNFIDTRAQAQTIDKLIAFGTWGVNLNEQGSTERLQGIRLSADAFQILGVQPLAGRALEINDENENSARVVMLSHALWQRRFGGDPNAIGRALILNGVAYTIVGVIPRDFVIPNVEVEVVTPLRLETDPRRSERGSNFLRVMARLKPGITPRQTQLEFAAISDRLRQQFPEDNGNLTAPRVLPLQDELIGGYREGLFILLGAVGVVLLIACSNLANLQVARVSMRQREIAIRTALGATRWHLLRQLLAEGILLALVGGVLGLLVALWGKDFLLSLAPADFPRATTGPMDFPVLIFCSAVSLVAGILVGLAPAWFTLRSDINCEISGRTEIGGSGHSRTRNILIIGEIALSIVLLVGAGIVMKSFARLSHVSPGFAADRSLAVRLSLPSAKYVSGEAVKNFYDRLAARLNALPGLESLSAVSALPMSGLTARTEFLISGRPPAKASDVPAAQHRWVAPGYFATMRIPLVRGRDFTESDNSRAAETIIVDQPLTRRFFADQEPIGAHILITMGDGTVPREYEIVGIAGSVRHNSLNEEPIPTFYGPIPQAPKGAVPFLANNFSIVVRSAIEPQALAATVRKELRDIDPDVAISSVKQMTQFIAASVAPRRFNAILLVAFATTALLLAGSGLYAIIAFLVSQRTREIGVRVALGAQRRDIFNLVIGHSFRLVLFGIFFGLISAVAATRLLTTLTFNTSATDPITYAMVAILLAAVAFIASYVPARRAMRIDPMVALRYE